MKTSQEKAKDLKEEIILYITNANLDEALKLMLDLAMLINPEDLPTVQQMMSQHKRIVKDNIKGIISRDRYNLEINVVSNNILTLTNSLFDEINKERPNNLKLNDDPQEIIEKQELNNNIIFESKDLGKTYKRTKFALSNINLTIKEGEITAIAGANAVGKTTLLRLIASDLLPDYGNVYYPLFSNKSKLDYSEIKQHIAYIPQEIPKWFGSLKDSIHFEAAMHGIKGKANDEAVNYILARLGLEKYSQNTWKELSSGYKLRFHLAKALVWKPRLLILDEPLAFLDIKAQRIVLNDLRNLVKNGTSPLSVVISSQHLLAIEDIADYFVFLDNQRILYNGDANGFNSNSTVKIFQIRTSAALGELKAAFQGIDCKIWSLYRKVFILEIDQKVQVQEIYSLLSKFPKEVNQVQDITLSLKRFFL